MNRKPFNRSGLINLVRNFTVNKYLKFFKNHRRRLAKFSALGIVMTAISFGILYLQVNHGVAPIFAYMVENVFMLQLGFALNRYIIFSDRSVPFTTALLKWNTYRIATLLMGQVVYFILTDVARLQYMLASITVAAIFGIVNYALSHRWAFAKH